MEQRSGEQPPDVAAGDYEYDEAHEQQAHVPRGPRAGRSVPAPAGRRPPDPEGDMSYDEAHDF